MPRYIIVAPALAGVFHGLTGFAGSIILMLILVPFIPLSTLSPLVALFGIGLNLFLIILHRKSLARDRIRPLLLPTLLGIPFGYLLLWKVSPELISRCIALGIILFICLQYVQTKREQQYPHWLSDLFARLAGIFGFAYNINGPQIAAWLLVNKIDKEQAISLSAAYFLFSGIVFVFLHLMSHAYAQPAIRRGQAGIVFSCFIISAYLGDVLRTKISAYQYQGLLYIFLVCSAVMFWIR